MNDYTASNAKGSTFWMTLEDFTKFFYLLTISYNDVDHVPSYMQD